MRLTIGSTNSAGISRDTKSKQQFDLDSDTDKSKGELHSPFILTLHFMYRKYPQNTWELITARIR